MPACSEKCRGFDFLASMSGSARTTGDALVLADSFRLSFVFSVCGSEPFRSVTGIRLVQLQQRVAVGIRLPAPHDLAVCVMVGPFEGEPRVEIRRFGTIRAELEQLRAWLQQEAVTYVVIDYASHCTSIGR
jgi:hypothetical protein